MLSSKLAPSSYNNSFIANMLDNSMLNTFALVFMVFGCLNPAHFSCLNWLHHIGFGLVYTYLGFLVGVLSKIDSFYSFKTRFYACLAVIDYVGILFGLMLLHEGYRNAAFHVHVLAMVLGMFLIRCLLDCLRSFPFQIPCDETQIFLSFFYLGVLLPFLVAFSSFLTVQA